jgi:ribose 5-phosphate isomerase B
MRIHMAGNHEGYALARELEKLLRTRDHDVQWHGPQTYDDGDDYPVYAINTAQAVVADEDAGVPTAGLLIGRSGAGESIAANKVNGARAIPGTSTALVKEARGHADANILCLGTAFADSDLALTLVETFLNTPFGNTLDDARRIVNTTEYETSGTIEGWMLEH